MRSAAKYEKAIAAMVGGPISAQYHKVDNPRPHEKAMKKLYGYVRSKREPCPRTVARHKCLRWFRNVERQGVQCLCQKHAPLLDHAKAWRDELRHAVLTSEPYHVDPQALEALRADCEALGLEVEVGGYSPWYPGSTTLITIRVRL